MKLALAAVLLLAPRLVAADDTQPQLAEFIPPQARIYFDCSKSPMYWGAESLKWRLGLRPVDGPWEYLKGGGHGESISLELAVFTPEAPKDEWLKYTSLRITIRVSAEGLPDFVRTESLEFLGRSANDYGISWSLRTALALHPLEQHWGTAPSKIRVTAVLAQDSLPPASTSVQSVALAPFPREKASWTRLVGSLRVGQTRKEIEALLGTPKSEKTRVGTDGSSMRVLSYPNPDSPPGIAPNLLHTQIALDESGKLIAVMLFGC
jgi:hypothetical protein